MSEIGEFLRGKKRTYSDIETQFSAHEIWELKRLDKNGYPRCTENIAHEIARNRKFIAFDSVSAEGGKKLKYRVKRANPKIAALVVRVILAGGQA